MSAPIYLLVQGMHLRADSIAHDVLFHKRVLERAGRRVVLGVERHDPRNYPDVDSRTLPELSAEVRREPGPVIYHWVDGWKEADAFLQSIDVPIVVRWHNNTPPWFFARHSPVPTYKTVRGYRALLALLRILRDASVWTNSAFSAEQLAHLGVSSARVDVVFPTSPYLEHEADVVAAPDSTTGAVRILFVGRVVPHKGHRHVLAAAAATAALVGREVVVTFVGRPDGDMPGYAQELRALAARLDVSMELPGEVSRERVDRAYREADVFVCLSEHEGFGLPVLEAMTRGLPVVGYRCTAVAEVLRDHPLAVDDPDPEGVARRIVAALDPVARDQLVDWQAAAVLPRHSSEVVSDQLLRALRGIEEPQSRFSEGAARRSSPTTVSGRPPPEVQDALHRAMERTLPPLDLPDDLPRDVRPHFVSPYDLEAYEALLDRQERGELRSRALGIEFGSHRPTVGGVVGRLKAAILRLQDGLIRTIEFSHDDLSADVRDLSARIEALKEEMARLVRESRRRSSD